MKQVSVIVPCRNERRYIEGLPILPVLGIKWEF
jgi:hypothetical protein